MTRFLVWNAGGSVTDLETALRELRVLPPTGGQETEASLRSRLNDATRANQELQARFNLCETALCEMEQAHDYYKGLWEGIPWESLNYLHRRRAHFVGKILTHWMVVNVWLTANQPAKEDQVR